MAALVASLGVDFIVTTGDNIQLNGTYDTLVGAYYSDYIGAYVGAYGPGSATNRFFPVLGNHDYTNGGGGATYHDFFTLPGANFSSTSGTERYYDFVWGPVHLPSSTPTPRPRCSGPGWKPAWPPQRCPGRSWCCTSRPTPPGRRRLVT